MYFFSFFCRVTPPIFLFIPFLPLLYFPPTPLPLPSSFPNCSLSLSLSLRQILILNKSEANILRAMFNISKAICLVYNSQQKWGSVWSTVFNCGDAENSQVQLSTQLIISCDITVIFDSTGTLVKTLTSLGKDWKHLFGESYDMNQKTINEQYKV